MASFLARNGVLLAALLIVPFFIGEFWTYQLGLYFVYAIAALGVGLAWGQAGILSLGQGMFIALAAYVNAHWLLSFGVSPLAYAGLFVAAFASALAGFSIAALPLRSSRIGARIFMWACVT